MGFDHPMRYPRFSIRWLLILTALVAILCYGILNIGSYIDSRRFSQRHVFVIPAPQEYITEADALMFARKTLEAEGYKIGDWELESEGYHSRSPNGEKDLYLNRASDPRQGGYNSGMQTKVENIVVSLKSN
jgi:hypothetical protein